VGCTRSAPRTPCLEACPVDAIDREDMVSAEFQKYIPMNADFFRQGER
jgi:Fe-S-cluster-containing hydrogenase component 2